MLLHQLNRVARADASFTRVDAGTSIGWSSTDDGTDAIDAEPIEDRVLAAHPVATAPSRFTAFLDGIQRTAVRLYHGPVPIVHAFVAAVVRERRNGSMTLGTPPLLDEREALFFPFSLLHPDQLHQAGLDPTSMHDTGGAGEPLPLFPPLLEARASHAVNRWREHLERTLAARWGSAADHHEWLLVDGSLSGSPELAASRRTVGLVASHRTRFFDGDEARTLRALPAAHRTSVFQPRTRMVAPVHSWYLRLRDPTHRDVLFGLVRVEIPASVSSIELADQISGWLLGESRPVALPDASWDRSIYPLSECARFLAARAQW